MVGNLDSFYLGVHFVLWDVSYYFVPIFCNISHMLDTAFFAIIHRVWKKVPLYFLANVNSSSCSLYVIVGPSVVCLSSVVCDARAPYSDD